LGGVSFGPNLGGRMEDPWAASVNPPAVEHRKTNAAPDWRSEAARYSELSL